MILEIDNVELYFKNKTILNGIYLKAETGKVTIVFYATHFTEVGTLRSHKEFDLKLHRMNSYF